MISGILVNLVSSALWGAVIVVSRPVLRTYRQRDPRFHLRVLSYFAGAILIILGASLAALALAAALPVWGWLATTLATSSLVIILAREMTSFWHVGLRGADRRISKGLDYAHSLRLCRNELSFLGTGATKLTRSPEFEKAVYRCRGDVKVRLLLRRPDDPALIASARQEGIPEDVHKGAIISSLRTIANIAQRTGKIEVRFYEGDLVFRIMLIDRTVALVSYVIFGEGDGSQLPQLHLVDAGPRGRTVESFFHAFERYFNVAWQTGIVWDFKSYI